MLYGWCQWPSVVVMRPSRRPNAQALGLAVCATALLGGRCSKTYDHLNREDVCAELAARGSCVEGDTDCVRVSCERTQNCYFEDGLDSDPPLIWVSMAALDEVEIWCQDQGGYWAESWCDNTRREIFYDVEVACSVDGWR